MRALVAGFVCFTLGCSYAWAAPDVAHGGGIQASGRCLKKVAQDRGSIVVSSSIVAQSPKEASTRATKAHEEVKAAIAKLQLRDFESETLNYSINEECSYESNRRSCRGFRAVFTTRFETSEIDRIGEAITQAAKSSTEEVSQLSTFVSPAKLKGERESCLEAASQDAAAKAAKLALGAGVKRGRLIGLAELPETDTPSPFVPRSTYAVGMVAEGIRDSPAIESKPIDLEVVVRATYAID